MADLSTLDSIVLGVLGIGIARGPYIGLIREGFSIAALGGGLIAIRYGTPPVAAEIARVSGGELSGTVATWVAAAAIGLGVVAIVGTAGKMLRKGARAVGLGWADRIAGGLVGLVEGALAAAVIVVGAMWAMGDDSPLVENARSPEILEQLQDYLADHRDELPAVAAPLLERN